MLGVGCWGWFTRGAMLGVGCSGGILGVGFWSWVLAVGC